MAKKTKSGNLMGAQASVTPGMMKMSKDEKKRMMDYQCEDDIRTLHRASEIKKDKGRVAAVEKHLRKQSDAVGKVLK